MPAESLNQLYAAKEALRAKRGEISANELGEAARQMYDNMSEEQIRHFAETDPKSLPRKVKKEWLEIGTDVEIILDGRKYLLEKGDRIFVENDDGFDIIPRQRNKC